MTIEQMIARQQELLNAARSAGRNMTREEAAEFDSLQRSIDAARAAGAGIAHGGQSSTPAAPANNTPEGQRQQTPAAGEGGNGGQDPQNAQRAIEAERQRIRSIEDLCTEFGLDARSYIDNGSTEEQVRAAVLEHLRSQHSPVATGIQVTDTQEDKFRRAAADSLLMRSGMTLERPEDGARSLMGMSIRDLAIECLQRDGSSESNLNRRSSDELYTMMARGFYNPEASFPAILDQTIEKRQHPGSEPTLPVQRQHRGSRGSDNQRIVRRPWKRDAMVPDWRSWRHRLHRGRLPERSGDPEHQKNGSSWTAWIYLGYLPRLGYLRNGLPRSRKEPRNQGRHEAEARLRGRRNKSWQQQHSGREARLSIASMTQQKPSRPIPSRLSVRESES